MFAIFAVMASAVHTAADWKVSILCISTEVVDPVTGHVINPCDSALGMFDNWEEYIKEMELDLNGQAIMRDTKKEDFYGTVMSTTPERLNEDLPKVTGGYALLILVDQKLDAKIDLSRLNGRFHVSIQGALARYDMDGDERPLAKLSKELYKLKNSKLSRKEHADLASKAFFSAFKDSSAQIDTQNTVTLTCGDDGSLDATVDFLALNALAFTGARPYYVEKKCHVPVLSFVKPQFASQKDLDNLQADYCLMENMSISTDLLAAVQFPCKDMGILYRPSRDSLTITLDDNGFRAVVGNGRPIYYRNDLVPGHTSLLYTTNTLVNTGGVKVDVVLKVSETATNVRTKLNISAQSEHDYSLMFSDQAIYPGFYSLIPIYDDPHMEISFDSDSDWSKVKDLDLIAEVRNTKRLQIGEIPAGAVVRVTKGSIDDRPVGAGSIYGGVTSQDKPAPESGNESAESEQGVSPGATAGIAVGAAVFAGVVVAVVILFVLPMCKGGNDDGDTEKPEVEA